MRGGGFFVGFGIFNVKAELRYTHLLCMPFNSSRWLKTANKGVAFFSIYSLIISIEVMVLSMKYAYFDVSIGDHEGEI